MVLLSGPPALAQAPARFGVDGAVSVDLFRGQNAPERPNIVVDFTASVRLGGGWLAYVRPWFRQPRQPGWTKEIYQAALQYERPGRVSTRVDLGYIVWPIGLGMMDTRPGLNPTISPHLAYFTPMPAFDPSAPRSSAIAATYPLGGQIALSADRWDTRVAVVSSAPNRTYVINRPNNPRMTPVLEAGAGFTPTAGFRVGVAFAQGRWARNCRATTTAASRWWLSKVNMRSAIRR